MKKMGKILLMGALALGSTTLTGCGVESIVSAVGGGGNGGGGGFGLGSIQKLLGGVLKFPNIGIGSIGNIGNGNTVNVGNTGNTSITDSTVGGYPVGTVESAPLAPIPTDDGSVPVADNGGGSSGGGGFGGWPVFNEGDAEPFKPEPYEPQDGSEA